MRAPLLLLAMTLPLAGCAGLLDPFQRDGTWAPTSANDANLGAMVVNPVDLQHGTGATDSVGVIAADAVTRERTDKIKSLPTYNTSSAYTASSSGGGGGGGGGSQ